MKNIVSRGDGEGEAGREEERRKRTGDEKEYCVMWWVSDVCCVTECEKERWLCCRDRRNGGRERQRRKTVAGMSGRNRFCCVPHLPRSFSQLDEKVSQWWISLDPVGILHWDPVVQRSKGAKEQRSKGGIGVV
jgi:hypothetical protein